MKNLIHVIDESIATFTRTHGRNPSVILLGKVHVHTLRLSGELRQLQGASYHGISIEEAPRPLHVSVG